MQISQDFSRKGDSPSRPYNQFRVTSFPSFLKHVLSSVYMGEGSGVRGNMVDDHPTQSRRNRKSCPIVRTLSLVMLGMVRL